MLMIGRYNNEQLNEIYEKIFIVDAIKYDATVQVAIPMESLLIQATGANAGGPVTCVGTNLLDSIGNGIMQ